MTDGNDGDVTGGCGLSIVLAILLLALFARAACDPDEPMKEAEMSMVPVYQLVDERGWGIGDLTDSVCSDRME